MVTALALALMLAGQPERPRPDPSGPPADVLILAILVLPQDQWGAPNNHAFRSVAIRMPMVYVGDREGDLYIFKIDASAVNQRLLAVRTVKNVGDGNDLKLAGDVLLCTREGQLEAYSLKDPEKPEHGGTHGPPGPPRLLKNDSLVIEGERAFLLGRHNIVRYDLSNPAEPRFVSTLELTNGSPWAGCIVGNCLYTAEPGIDGDARGVGVYDISKPDGITRKGFVPTPQTPYALHPVRGDRLLVCLDSSSLVLVGNGPHGNSQILSLADPWRPSLVHEAINASGRASTLLSTADNQYLVCHGAVFRVAERALRRISPLVASGSTLDGAAYHGGADGVHGALALDHVAVVIKISERGGPGEPPGGRHR